MSLAKSFTSCTFAPATEDKDGNSTLVSPSPIGTWKTTSFFIDSSGRSSFTLPLQLTFASKEDLDVFLAAKCLDPAPENVEPRKSFQLTQPPGGYKAQNTSFFLDPANANNADAKEDAKEAAPEESSDQSESSVVGFEVKSYSVDEAKTVVIEGVNILSCSVQDLTVCFQTEVTVRASNHQYDSPDKSGVVEPHRLNVLTNLEITPILTIHKIDKQNGNLDVPDLMALELGAIPDHMQKESSARVHETKLSSMALNVTLTHAFTIAVKSFPGPSLGTTLISLTIRHSDSHSEPVIISNIALHPGHSRYETIPKKRRGAGAQYSITNMTKSMQWGYAPKTELSLPLTLGPRDAYCTVLTVNAGEEMQSRAFISPVSVTGAVGKASIENDDNASISHSKRVVVAAEAHWSTELVAVEPVDAFRIEMNVKQSEVKVGQPMYVSLRIFNLGLDPRDLMLLMAKDERKGTTAKDEAVNTAVVSEVSGYTFGVWGISGEDDGTVRLNRDHELLAIDAALLLGEVLGQHAVDAELRFVPLREGRLKVPNWKLYDKAAGKWYTCTHNLGMVAEA